MDSPRNYSEISSSRKDAKGHADEVCFIEIAKGSRQSRQFLIVLTHSFIPVPRRSLPAPWLVLTSAELTQRTMWQQMSLW